MEILSDELVKYISRSHAVIHYISSPKENEDFFFEMESVSSKTKIPFIFSPLFLFPRDYFTVFLFFSLNCC